MSEESWHLKQADVLIGTLFLVDVDQPWIKCRFEPSGEWSSLQGLFEAQERAVENGDPGEMMGPILAVRELDLRLHPTGGGELIQPVMIYIGQRGARFRY